MNTKKLISGLLALTLVFGETALPNSIMSSSLVAAAQETDTIADPNYLSAGYFGAVKSGDYYYHFLEDDTIEIDMYFGEDEKVVMPSEFDGYAVTSIGEIAFLGKPSVREITIPEGVTSIGERSFSVCFNIESIVIPDTVICIGDKAFSQNVNIYCNSGSYAEEYAKANGLKYNLISSDFDYTLLKDGTVEITKYNGDDAEVEIPAEIDGVAVTSIGKSAFDSCYNLVRITLPNSLKHIKNCAFRYCGFESIVIPDSVEDIEEEAFYGCGDLKSVILPKNLKIIGEGTFVKCCSLESITLPNSLKHIKNDAFFVCGIESIVIPDSVEDIEPYAFGDCNDLKSVTLSKNLKNINEGTFNGCSNLDNIVIPDGVKSIGEEAFRYCTHLKSVTIPKSVTVIGKNAFEFTDPVTINCYSGSCAEEYAKANGLKYKLIDETEPNCPPPVNLRAIYSEKYHQIRFYWEPVKGAEKYGLAVYLSGKWRVWTSDIPADVTAYTSPKNLTPGTKYKVCVAAKVNGKWNTSDPIKNAITVTVK